MIYKKDVQSLRNVFAVGKPFRIAINRRAENRPQLKVTQNLKIPGKQ
jgi:hypothetical protein